MMRVGLFPGWFDPFSLGLFDIFWRASALVDKLVLGVAIIRDLGPLFSFLYICYHYPIATCDLDY